MGLEPSLNVTPKGSLVDIPAAVDRERKKQLPEEGLQETSSETTYMEIPDTRVKTVPGSTTREAPRIIQRMKEASREGGNCINSTIFCCSGQEKYKYFYWKPYSGIS